MPSSPFDCLCAGIVVADHVCEPIDHLPEAGRLVLTPGMTLTIGGSASNTAVDLSKLGLSVALAGTVGDDVLGHFVRAELEAAGVNCDALQQSTTSQTATTMVVNVRNEDRRFIHVVGAIDEFTADEVTSELIRSCRVLHVAGFGLSPALSGENVARLFREARDAGVKTVLDVVVPETMNVGEMLEPVLPWTDVFLPNDDEARLITGLTDPVEQAEAFRSWGAETVVVTCGSNGAVLIGPNDRLKSESHDIEVIDGTGSGDAFAAGFILGLLDGSGIENCLRFGSALGASCVRTSGATSGAMTAAELEDFVGQHSLAVARI